MAVSSGSVITAPGRLPAVGHALRLGRDPIGFISSLGSVDRGVVRVQVGTRPLYFVTAYEQAREILIDQAQHFTKGRMFTQSRSLIGNGLLSSEGDFHRAQRRMMQPPFHHQMIEGYAQIMSRHSRMLADSWHAGQDIQLEQELYRLPLGTVTEALFSATDMVTPLVAEFARSMPVIQRTVPVRAFLPEALGALPLPVNRRFDAAVARVHRLIGSTIVQHRTRPLGRPDLLSLMESACDPETGTGMSDQQISDEIITMLLAGTETTVTALSWAFHEIARNPAIESRLHEEIDSTVGDRPLGFTDVARLTYTSQVINEVNRLYSALIVMRTAATDVTIGGIPFHAGAEIVICPYVIHRDPRFFSEPETFDPGRWEPARAGELPRGACIPFGAGSRKCIGDEFVMTELIIALATIGARWRLRPTERGAAVKAVTGVVPRPNQLPMTVQAR